jgi:hypothetical protein
MNHLVMPSFRFIAMFLLGLNNASAGPFKCKEVQIGQDADGPYWDSLISCPMAVEYEISWEADHQRGYENHKIRAVRITNQSNKWMWIPQEGHDRGMVDPCATTFKHTVNDQPIGKIPDAWEERRPILFPSQDPKNAARNTFFQSAPTSCDLSNKEYGYWCVYLAAVPSKYIPGPSRFPLYSARDLKCNGGETWTEPIPIGTYVDTRCEPKRMRLSEYVGSQTDQYQGFELSMTALEWTMSYKEKVNPARQVVLLSNSTTVSSSSRRRWDGSRGSAVVRATSSQHLVICSK